MIYFVYSGIVAVIALALYVGYRWYSIRHAPANHYVPTIEGTCTCLPNFTDPFCSEHDVAD